MRFETKYLIPIGSILFGGIFAVLSLLNYEIYSPTKGPMAGFMPVFTNIITWSTPVFLKGYIASNGDFRAVIMELICLICDIFIWFVFVRLYEKQLGKSESGLSTEN